MSKTPTPKNSGARGTRSKTSKKPLALVGGVSKRARSAHKWEERDLQDERTARELARGRQQQEFG